MRVAIFDFDGTLYEKETFSTLMDHLKNHPLYHKKYNRFIRSVLPRYIGSKVGVYPEARLKERSMRFYLDVFDKLSSKELDTYFEELAVKMRVDFNATVLSKIDEHVTDNVHVMLVSGAYTPLLHSVTRGLPFDEIIGTDIPLKEQRIDSKTPIFHINGIRKNKKILEALEGKKIDWANSFAYGDSHSDLSVLELVGNPVAVQPEPRLRSVAEKRVWQII
ncbi:HAD family hydrolase [Sporosarcina sp. CAU 1771]